MPDIHPTAVVHKNAIIGSNVKIWSGAVICAFAVIGENCVIGSNCYVGWGTVMGEGCRLNHGTFLPNKSTVGRDVFFGPNVTATDDKYPIAGNIHYKPEPPTFGDRCSIGAGATILPGIVIGENAMVGAGSVVTRNVPANTVVSSNPARIMYDRRPKEDERNRDTALVR